MEETQNRHRPDELGNNIEHAREKAFRDEYQRIESEVEKRSPDLIQNLRSREEQFKQDKLNQAKLERQNLEEALKHHEDNYRKKLEAELEKKSEERRYAEEQIRRQAEEEERKRSEEAERQKAEITRRLREEELRLQEEERKQKEKEEEQKREEQKRRFELEKKQREEERQRQEDEKKQRIADLLKNAELFFNSGDFEQAGVEAAKALVNDPTDERALELDRRIREARDALTGHPAETTTDKPRTERPIRENIFTPKSDVKRRFPLPLSLGLAAGLLLAGIVIFLQLKKDTFKFPMRMAVLPWTSTSGSLEENIIGSSLAEEAVRYLAAVKPVHVSGYRSSYLLTRHTSDPEREAFRLGNAFILVGTLSYNEDYITINLKLIDSLGNAVWKEHFQKPTSAMPDLPGEIAENLIRGIGVNNADALPVFNRSRSRASSDAFLFYLRGLELMHRRTPESTENAYQLFLQAIQQNPGFTEGLAAATDVLAVRLENGWSRGDSVITQARHLAEAAVTSDPSIDRGYLALARLSAFENDYRSALANIDSAIYRAPNNYRAYFEQGRTFFKIAESARAFESLQRAFKLNPSDPDVLQTLASVHQLSGYARQGLPYHETALKYVRDSLEYLATRFADAISGDPELRLKLNNRIISACFKRLNSNPNDYAIMYHLARLRQISGDTDATDMMIKTEEIIRDELSRNPGNTNALTYLTLTLTRLGRFSEAVIIAKLALSLEPDNDAIYYGIAQMYSLQMYSRKENKLDDVKKGEAVRHLSEALRLNYRFPELTSADFFNMFQQPDYFSVIQKPMK